MTPRTSTVRPLPERLRRRRRMLAWSAPFLGGALLLGPYLLGVAVADDRHRSTAATDPAAAADAYTALADDTPYGPSRWVTVYNTGTSALMAGQAPRAVEELTEALDIVPVGVHGEDGEVDPELPECLVRRNLSLSYEILADEAAAAGDLTMVEEHLLAALDALGECATEAFVPPEQPEEPEDEEETEEPEDQEGEGSEEPSEGTEDESGDSADDQGGDEEGDGAEGEDGEDPEGGDGGDQQDDGGDQQDEGADQGGNPNDPIQDRQVDKLQQNQDQQDSQDGQGGGDGPDDPGGEGGPDEEPLSPQEQELQDRNRQAEEERRQQEQRSGGGYGGGQNW